MVANLDPSCAERGPTPFQDLLPNLLMKGTTKGIEHMEISPAASVGPDDSDMASAARVRSDDGSAQGSSDSLSLDGDGTHTDSLLDASFQDLQLDDSATDILEDESLQHLTEELPHQSDGIASLDGLSEQSGGKALGVQESQAPDAQPLTAEQQSESKSASSSPDELPRNRATGSTEQPESPAPRVGPDDPEPSLPGLETIEGVFPVNRCEPTV